MAHEHAGPQPKAPWTTIFSAFKVALDLKKLLLAAAGIFLTSLGWWMIGGTFYGIREEPKLKAFDIENEKDSEKKNAMWNEFRISRSSWNLLHKLAGPPSSVKLVDAADVANDLDEFLLLSTWEEGYKRLSRPIHIKGNSLEVPDYGPKPFTLTPVGPNSEDFAKLDGKTFTVGDLVFDSNPAEKNVSIAGVLVKVTDGSFTDLKKYREGAKDLEQIRKEANRSPKAKQALHTFETRLRFPERKPSGLLRNWPWFEYRGENPYLIVTNKIKPTVNTSVAEPSLLNWIFTEQAPVLLEPIFRFLTPLVYMFHQDARGWDRLYLILVILWALVVWGFFGGAICRIAAVQVARNERITLKEAIVFARERMLSYIVAPIFPLTLLAMLTFALWIFGWLEWTGYVGDLFAGLAWPVVLLIGFIMAIVMVGLVGWPLMNATISTEGSDSFDALSRSYSYVYQAPWQYLWYSFLAIVYGAVLVFFIGLMASLIVFLGKWGVSSTPGLSSPDPKWDREPSYLFDYAPTSFGWRDLLISSSPFLKNVDEPSGNPLHKSSRRDFTDEYRETIHGFNRFGAVLVAIWIYLFFLLVVGFGYSYFWSASTIIYFLMRNNVDDTPMDEVHLEDEALDDPFMKPVPAAPTAPAPVQQGKPGTVSLNVVEGPAPTMTPTPPLSAVTPATPSAPVDSTSDAGVSDLPAPSLATPPEDHPPQPENPQTDQR